MEHVETWPNIYKNGETYVSVKWNGSDPIGKVCQLLKDKEKNKIPSKQRMARIKESL